MLIPISAFFVFFFVLLDSRSGQRQITPKKEVSPGQKRLLWKSYDVCCDAMLPKQPVTVYIAKILLSAWVDTRRLSNLPWHNIGTHGARQAAF